jgi:phosphatidylinositol-3,4,5-trisphosphate 3-phosphatase and dual-specificity protein phosphatase PTEN
MSLKGESVAIHSPITSECVRRFTCYRKPMSFAQCSSFGDYAFARSRNAPLARWITRTSCCTALQRYVNSSLLRINAQALYDAAGKGRSGTMACTCLLSLETEVAAPKLQRSYNAKQWAKIRAEEAMKSVPEDETDVVISELEAITDDPRQSEEDLPQATSPATMTSFDKEALPKTSTSATSPKSFKDSLNTVLDLHTSRRMKAPSSADKKAKQGVSIPSQRRWLYYWALLLSHEAPAHLWATKPLVPSPNTSSSILSMPVSEIQSRPKVRLTEIKLRLKEMSSMRMNILKVANTVLEATNMGKAAKDNGNDQIWVSLARYDDDFVEMLERWERYTRGESANENGQVGLGNMGRRKAGSEHFGNEVLSEMFKEGKWDSQKMVRSFARMGTLNENAVVKSEDKTVCIFI